jgi:hypothetical protein
MANDQGYLNNLAEFKRGQQDGVTGVINVMTRVINGTDKGSDALKDRELEKVRRVFLLWRDFIIADMKVNNEAKNVLLETKKIMDIVIPK